MRGPGCEGHSREIDYLPDTVLDSMIDRLLFDVDEEGGPRCSCVDCFFKPARQLRASYRTPQGRPVIEDAMRVEGEIGFTMKQGHSLKSLLEEGIPRS